MATKSMIVIAYVALIPFISMSENNPFAEASKMTGFTTDLIHRESPQSPYYNPSLSPSQRIVNAMKRSFNRAQHFKGVPTPDIIPAGGEYLMEYSLGTPPVRSLGIADTGSDRTWTQCQPCLQCFNQSLPIFKPKSSSTYKVVSCNNPKCNLSAHTGCNMTRKNNCHYYETYGDGSTSKGELATDTFTLASSRGKNLSISKIVFGCGFSNSGIFSGSESGIIGLGGGKASFVRNLGRLARLKFSYCLVPLSGDSSSSKLHFGTNAEIWGSEVVSTPLVDKFPETYYYLTLEGMSFGNQRLEWYEPFLSDHLGHHQRGNIIIDSGTTLTYLPSGLYAKLEKAIKSWIKLKRIKDPEGVAKLCYFSRENVRISIPEITVHFKGADLKLKQENIFVRTSNVSLCLAATPTDDLAIYGNIAQINFFVGYDLGKRTVSFKPTDCSK